jgi:hypothetical protein
LTRGLLLARKIQRFRFNDLRDSWAVVGKTALSPSARPFAAGAAGFVPPARAFAQATASSIRVAPRAMAARSPDTPGRVTTSSLKQADTWMVEMLPGNSGKPVLPLFYSGDDT